MTDHGPDRHNIVVEIFLNRPPTKAHVSVSQVVSISLLLAVSHNMTGRTVLEEYPASGIVKLILNRPAALNALNADLLEDLVVSLRKTAMPKSLCL